MQDELLQFKLQKVWTLVDLPYGKRAIGTKWVYRNKKDDRDYDEAFAPIARIEAIRLFLAYASFMNFIVISGLKRLKQALYGLHQAPRAWYETLSTYLLENGFRRGTIDKTLFIKKDKGDILLVQVKQKDDGIFISQDKYVADILKKFDFATVKTASTPMETNKALLKDEEAADVDVHLYRSMIGSLMYLTTSRPDIMFAVCACARFQVTPKTSHLHAVKRIFRYLKGHPKLGLWYPRDSPFDLEAFSDSDYAGASLDRKSTTGGCQFLGRRLISWQCKKQTIVANSTTKAEYVAAANCCGQVLWIQNQLLDYGYNFMNTKIFIDNESIICIVKNPVFHSKTKHIEIRHHFIRDSYEKRLIQVIKIHTDHNVADLLTKAFDVSRFQYLIANETVIKEWEDRMERAATTASSLEAEQDNVAFLEKPEESNGFEGIIDFLNASSIKYALTVNPTIYESCIKQFWATAKAKTVNGERQIQALVDKRSAKTTTWNEFISTMASAIICLATNQKFNFSKYIFDNMMKNLEGGVKFLMYPRFVQVFLDKQVEGMSKHKGIYVTPSHTKKVFANMKRPGKDFSGKVTPLFQTMMVQAPEAMGEDSTAPTDSHSTPIITQPSLSKPQKKKSRRKQRKDSGPTEPIPDEATNEEPISTPSCDPPQSGEDSLQLTELMSLCTKLQKQVLDLEEAKTAQAKEIASLKKRVKQLEKRRKSRTSGIKRLRKGRKIADLDADEEVTLIDETQGRNDEDLMFDTDVLNGDEVFEEPIVNAAKTTSSIPVSVVDPVTTAGEVVTTASATTTVDELTLAQTLIEIKAAKPKAVTTAATIITTDVASTRPKAKGIVFHDQEEQAPAFTPIRAAEQRSKPPTKTQIRNRMCTYLKNMGGYKHNQLKGRSYEEIQKLFDKAYKQLESDKSKKQKIDEHVEAEKDDDQEEAEMKKHIEIVKDDEVAIDAIPLATKPPMIVDYKINIDREDLETLWKLFKAKHRNTRPEEDYERVLWGDLKSAPMTQAAIRRMIKENVNVAIVAKRARHANVGNDVRGSGPARGAVKLLRWFEKTESVFGISNCAEGKKVKFAVATLQGPALTWWNARIETMGLETVKEYNIVAYTQRFNKLALMCPRMVEPKRVKVDAYIRGLADNIKGEVTSSKLANL
ncbi:putative ribonuclease H-like domain-containing protein [Tanacetum coccineum]